MKKTKNDDSLKTYFDQIKDIPLLTFEEELELSRRIQKGDKAARSRMIEANLRLVIKIAKVYLASKVSLMDLIQEGNIGLMLAVDKYDHQKQVRFSTYAAWWIRQTITRYLSNKRRTIRIPHRKEEMLRKIQQAKYTLTQLHMRQPTIEEIAAEINISAGDVEFLLGFNHEILPFEGGDVNTDSRTIMDCHEDYTYCPERTLLKKSTRQATLEVLDRLKEREKRILIYRYQLYGEKRHTLKNISNKMGISTETVRQIELKALRKLRGHAEDMGVGAYVGAM